MGVEKIPMPKGCPMQNWISTARYTQSKNGKAKALVWINKYVPEQLRQAIKGQL